MRNIVIPDYQLIGKWYGYESSVRVPLVVYDPFVLDSARGKRFVNAQHEGIISEALFYEVQDILDGRRRHYRPKSATLPELPLRGF